MALGEQNSWVTTEVPDVPCVTWYLLSGGQLSQLPIINSVISQRELILKQELDEQCKPAKAKLELIQANQAALLSNQKERT